MARMQHCWRRADTDNVAFVSGAAQGLSGVGCRCALFFRQIGQSLLVVQGIGMARMGHDAGQFEVRRGLQGACNIHEVFGGGQDA